MTLTRAGTTILLFHSELNQSPPTFCFLNGVNNQIWSDFIKCPLKQITATGNVKLYLTFKSVRDENRIRDHLVQHSEQHLKS